MKEGGRTCKDEWGGGGAAVEISRSGSFQDDSFKDEVIFLLPRSSAEDREGRGATCKVPLVQAEI